MKKQKKAIGKESRKHKIDNSRKPLINDSDSNGNSSDGGPTPNGHGAGQNREDVTPGQKVALIQQASSVQQVREQSAANESEQDLDEDDLF